MSDKSGPQSVLWALFSLQGRMRVQSFRWGAALIGAYWWIAIAQLNTVSKGHTDYNFWLVIFALTVLLSTYNIYALCHKRLHDLGYPGLFSLLAVGLSFLLPFIMPMLLGVLSFKAGENADNDYGPPPLHNKKTK
ncbi:MAG: DUF805 domain-containing protein [Rhizobiaceae bacterium]